MKEFRGMFPAMITPLTKDDKLDEEGLRGNIEWYIKEGSHGISCLGSIGKYTTLTDEERKRVIDITVAQTNHRVPVQAGVGGRTTKDTIRWTQYAKDAGADLILLPNPYYHLPDEKELYEHIKKIARAVNIPIMLYNNVRGTGADCTPKLAVRLAKEFENFSYFKASAGTIQRVQEIIRKVGNHLTVFSGDDALAFPIFVLGGKGAIDGTAAILPRKRAQLFELVEKGEIEKARELWYKMVPLVTVLESESGWHNFTMVLKKGLDLLGKAGGPSPRGPKLDLSKDQEVALKKMLSDLGEL